MIQFEFKNTHKYIILAYANVLLKMARKFNFIVIRNYVKKKLFLLSSVARDTSLMWIMHPEVLHGFQRTVQPRLQTESQNDGKKLNHLHTIHCV